MGGGAVIRYSTPGPRAVAAIPFFTFLCYLCETFVFALPFFLKDELELEDLPDFAAAAPFFTVLGLVLFFPMTNSGFFSFFWESYEELLSFSSSSSSDDELSSTSSSEASLF